MTHPILLSTCTPHTRSAPNISLWSPISDGFFGEPECRIFVPSPPQEAPKIEVLSPTSFNVSWDDASDYASGDALQWEVFVDGSVITEFDVNRGSTQPVCVCSSVWFGFVGLL